MKKVLAAAAVTALVGLVALGSAWVFLERQVVTPASLEAGVAPVEFTVPRGATGRTLGEPLVTAGLIQDARVWRYHLWRRRKLNAKAGRHLLSAGMTMVQLGDALESPPLPEDEPWVMIEGWRLRDTEESLVSRHLCAPGDYVRAASDRGRFKVPFAWTGGGSLEGYLYPETYGVVPATFSVDALIQRQLDMFVQRVWEPHKDEVLRSGRTLEQLVTMASLLEREEPVPAQRALVAGILWKRLDASFPLGVDATSRYELAEWNDRKAFLKKLRDTADPWNTRHKPGLPPGPIGAPTVDSFLAALRPQKSEHWYYLHDAQRVLHPSRNAEEHEALRNQYNVH